MRPILGDGFCCQGIGASGYIRAGFRVIGGDNAKRHGRYYPGAFVLSDWREFIEQFDSLVDAWHMSPPCQGYTRGNAGKETKWPRLIGAVREVLESTGKPYVIENVEDAGPCMIEPTKLCGCMFDLQTVDTDGVTIHLQRPRLFETNFPLFPPRPCDHSDHEWVAGAYGGARRDKYEAKYVRKGGYVPPDKAVVQRLLGVQHETTWEGLFESIPPAYTEHIGQALTAHLYASEVAA